MKLHELHVLVGDAGARHHRGAVARARVRRGAREVGAAVAARRHHRVVGAEAVEGAVLQAHGDHAHALAALHDEVEGEVLDEEVGVVSERLAVEGVEERVAGPVGDAAAALGLAAVAVVQAGAAKGALVDSAVGFAAERRGKSFSVDFGKHANA